MSGWLDAVKLPAYTHTAEYVGSAILVVMCLALLAALIALWRRRR